MRDTISLSVGIASAALIAFQLVIMQMLSISQWHHFAYMVISMAMLGFGAAGTFLALFREMLKKHFDIVLPVLYLLTGISMALSTRMVGIFGDFDTFLLFFDRSQIGLMVFSYLVYCLPFFFGGLAITLVFYHKVSGIGGLYFFNLVGSALGALMIIALLHLMPLAYIPALLSLLPMVSAWLVRVRRRGYTLASAALLAIPIAGFLYPASPAISEFKSIYGSLQLPDARITYERTGPYGLLQAVSAPAQRFAPALSLQYRGEPPVRDILFNNGEYFGTLLGLMDGDRHILDYTTRALPYAIRKQEAVLILGARTGNDVSHARYHGAGRITAVEPHRQANHLLTSRYPGWVDSLYHQPGVKLHGNSIRTWLAGQGDDTYGLAVLPVLGAFGGTSGINALQEQYHLTLESFREIWNRLDDDGMITISAWAEYPPRTSLRLLATWRLLLNEKGINQPEKHIMAVRNWGTITFLMSRSAFTGVEREKARAFSRSHSFDPLILEDIRPEERDYFHIAQDTSIFSHIDALLFKDPNAFFADYPFDVSPVTDNRPFFAHHMKVKSIPGLLGTYGPRELPYMELGVIMAAITLIQIVLVSIFLIILPLFRVGWKGTRRRWTFLYFAGIGIGFMFFEMVLIQKLVLYLGQPVYATAAVLAGLLVSSGFGSLYSSRLQPRRPVIVRTGVIIMILILLYTILLMPLLHVSMSWPTVAKALSVAVLLAPPAFFMGMMFPFGLRRLSGSNDTQIPWACGVDSCLSVSATALATMIALGSGFAVVMGLAALAYGLTTAAALRLGEGS